VRVLVCVCVCDCVYDVSAGGRTAYKMVSP